MLSERKLIQALSESADESLDFIVLATGERCGLAGLEDTLANCVRALRPGGLLFVQGCPEHLPEIGVFLDKRLTFKYWIAVESANRGNVTGLPSVHGAILLFAKGARFDVKKVRFPHESCAACGKSLRDWGGKSHLMHPDGHALSDVWKDLPREDNYAGISDPVLETILRVIGPGSKKGVIGSVGGSGRAPSTRRASRAASSVPDGLLDQIIRGDAVEVLRQLPDGCVDLAFADPPYNLSKMYSTYEDGRAEEHYVEWCDSWLAEYVRVLKPTGSLYVLNLPRWTMYHAEFLSRHLSLRNWIVWDALSEPRGKLMPAHYGLLFYTKHPTDFTFNYGEVGSLDSRRYCLRQSCVRRRKALGDDEKEPLTDIWWDIHRIRHRRDRDYHPCQLPDALLERIIRLSTNEGDVVLDALCGVGTTPVVAGKLGRRFVGIDIDPDYVEITRRKLAEVERVGRVVRSSTRKARPAYSKKTLQLELRAIAAKLGRLPSPEDVEQFSEYGLDAFLSTFPNWGKALKAAKLETSQRGTSPIV